MAGYFPGDTRSPGEEFAHNEAMESLRERTHEQIERSTAERISANPAPTEDELYMGAFREELEPQVADALIAMNRKGYATASSGFGGKHGEIQAIDGYFGDAVSGQAEENLHALGFEIKRGLETGITSSGNYISISFRPDEPDLEKIKKAWDGAAETLPDLGRRAPPSISGGAVDFRRQFAPERTDVEKLALEEALSREEYEPPVEAAMRKRLREISGG